VSHYGFRASLPHPSKASCDGHVLPRATDRVFAGDLARKTVSFPIPGFVHPRQNR
jgi:hypothetical protein